MDWERFAALVDGVYSEGEGRPSYPPLMMVKVLLLEQWYNLSDVIASVRIVVVLRLCQ